MFAVPNIWMQESEIPVQSPPFVKITVFDSSWFQVKINTSYFSIYFLFKGYFSQGEESPMKKKEQFLFSVNL